MTKQKLIKLSNGNYRLVNIIPNRDTKGRFSKGGANGDIMIFIAGLMLVALLFIAILA